MHTDEFMIVEEGPPPYSAFFEQDDETGYLYITDGQNVLCDLHIFNRRDGINLHEGDVRVVWNDVGKRCGLIVAGKLRGVLGINGDCYRPPMHSLESEGVLKAEWLAGFEPFIKLTTAD